MKKLYDYLKLIDLPNPEINPNGLISNDFNKLDIYTLWDAIAYVKKLPYAPISNKKNYRLVLEEKRGTCSVKHALLVDLAKELGVDLQLTFCIILLNARTLPRIIPILKQFGLEGIPEAHSYLKYKNQRLDITFPELSKFDFNWCISPEVDITPDQIGEFKDKIHHEFIHEWIKDKPHLTFELVWAARQACY